jgi:predicted acetyltransferase
MSKKQEKVLAKNVLKQAQESNLVEMISTYNDYFKTMSTNQVYIQENQVEFEKYLKDILKNQERIIKLLEK